MTARREFWLRVGVTWVGCLLYLLWRRRPPWWEGMSVGFAIGFATTLPAWIRDRRRQRKRLRDVQRALWKQRLDHEREAQMERWRQALRNPRNYL